MARSTFFAYMTGVFEGSRPEQPGGHFAHELPRLLRIGIEAYEHRLLVGERLQRNQGQLPPLRGRAERFGLGGLQADDG